MGPVSFTILDDETDTAELKPNKQIDRKRLNWILLCSSSQDWLLESDTLSSPGSGNIDYRGA